MYSEKRHNFANQHFLAQERESRKREEDGAYASREVPKESHAGRVTSGCGMRGMASHTSRGNLYPGIASAPRVGLARKAAQHRLATGSRTNEHAADSTSGNFPQRLARGRTRDRIRRDAIERWQEGYRLHGKERNGCQGTPLPQIFHEVGGAVIA